MENDLKILLETDDRVIAEDIQRILEESGIYSILNSDNAASSILSIYSGLNAGENIILRVNNNDFPKALEVLSRSQYKNLLTI
jgi:hypothetical protein